MSDYSSLVNSIRRPRLLIRAARFGLATYAGQRDLPRLLGGTVPQQPDAIVAALLSREADLEDARKNEMPGYNLARHIELLVALLAEARLLAPPADPASP